MSTKQQVLDILKNNENDFLSGQEMADRIYVSRAAVWKAIKALEKEGYKIDAVTNKGYRLKNETKAISRDTITGELVIAGVQKSFIDEVCFYDTVDSTNEAAKIYSNIHPEVPALFVAESQSKGKGRRGREFYSPSGTGLYMSLLLYPDTTPEKSTMFTCMMAVCVCKAIKEVTGIDTSIKWVNDIYLGDRKVAGILTEGMTSLEDGKLQYMVVGVGVNIYQPFDGFPDAISKSAGYILDHVDETDIRSKLCASIVKNFMTYYEAYEDRSFVEEYREKSMLIGKYVKLLTPGHGERKVSKGYARVTGIDDMCHLNIEYDDGTCETLNCGEVSVVKY